MTTLEKTNRIKGILLMVISSFLTANGQLMWKLYLDNLNVILLFLGFVFYGVGALSMILAFKFGELSVMYPMMCLSYVFAIINGYVFLNEALSLKSLLGIVFVIIGVTLIGSKSEVKK